MLNVVKMETQELFTESIDFKKEKRGKEKKPPNYPVLLFLLKSKPEGKEGMVTNCSLGLFLLG